MLKKNSKLVLTALLLSLALCSGIARAEEPYLLSTLHDKPQAVYSMIREDLKNRPSQMEVIPGTIHAGIVPHHLLAHAMMTDFFEVLSRQDPPNRIIIIGPDHHGRGLNFISISSLNWKTPFGTVAVDKAAIGQIQKELNLRPDDRVFRGEHSIANLMDFVGYYFPKATVVPVLLQPRTPAESVEALGRTLKPFLNDPGTLLLLSMDFSHHVTGEAADLHDQLTESSILRLDPKAIDRLDVDCPAGLYLLMHHAREAQWIPEIRDHSNGSRILDKPELKDVTSYYTVFFSDL